MQAPSASDSVAAFLGAHTVTVQYRSGETEIVHVRELPLMEIPAYAAALDDETRAVELFCGRPQGWAETLRRESLVDILEKGEALNLPFTVGWMQRRSYRNLKVAQSLGADVSSLVAQVAEKVGSHSAAGSPISPSLQATPQPKSQQ